MSNLIKLPGHRAPQRRITIIDVMRDDFKCKDFTTKLAKKVNWRVGSRMARYHLKHTGQRVLTELRPKTHGRGGSHDIATYPVSWRGRIIQVIREVAPQVKAKLRAERRAQQA